MQREVVLAVTVGLQLLGEEEEKAEGMVGKVLQAVEKGGLMEEVATIDGPTVHGEEGEVVVAIHG